MSGGARPSDGIEHVIVLMLENRSFDHVLGYLSLPEYAAGAPAVEGLRETHSNQYTGPEFDYGIESTVHHTHRLYQDPPEPYQLPPLTPLWQDPPHEAASQDIQINGGGKDMGGFVNAYAALLHKRLARLGRRPEWHVLGYPLGYLVKEDVPVFDHLARTYCVCDNWFCSVRGPTMPNRFFSVTGTTNGLMSNEEIVLHRRGAFRSLFQFLPDEPSSWRWYSSDPAILRAIDDEYLRDDHDHRFAFFDQATERQTRSFLTDLYGSDDQPPDLPHVAWIDPNFAIMQAGGHHLLSNDDHPPAQPIHGQKLVNKVYTALRESDYWDRSMLIVTYDEHGGFYDHVRPPRDELGPRVPTFVISPRVTPGAHQAPLDHAALIKTILTRFGRDGWETEMPARVAESDDLWSLIGDGYIEDDGVAEPLGAELSEDDRRPAYLPKPSATIPRAIELLDHAPTDLQADIARMAIMLRSGLRTYFRIQAWWKRRTGTRRPKLSRTPLTALAVARARIRSSDRKLAERRP